VASSCYIHIPFCAGICNYCDFYRVLHDSELERRFVAALSSEIARRMSDERGLPAPLKTLYFGGGTPTTLSLESWQRLFAALANYFDFGEGCEVTVEANPESASLEKLKLLKGLGVNRLSFGVQSFSCTNLERLGRIHSVEQVARSVDGAHEAGVQNVSIDLIYGLPDESGESLLNDLKEAAALASQHLSFYLLTLEGEVPLREQVLRGEVTLPGDDVVASRYLQAVEFLEKQGLQQYEISNFSRPGYECRHNLGYWQQQDYYAFGPAAVATLNGKRFRNQPDIHAYISNLTHGSWPPHEIEEITRSKRLLETIMLSLRLVSGLDTAYLRETYGYDVLSVRGELLTKLEQAGDLSVVDGSIRLTPQGMFRSDLISASLCPDFV
jgi:oxygen-independent coproporphyrinogen III oxidase